MSLRWIQENQEAPTCDEESSDIDDSGTDDSYDTDMTYDSNDNEDDSQHRKKRETTSAPTTTITFDENGTPVYNTTQTQRTIQPCVLWDPRKSMQNPSYQCRLIKFFCRTGYHLTISAVGRVCGQKNPHDMIAFFQFIPVSFGIIRIRNSETGHYLAFNKKGHLYGELEENKDNIEWEQWSIGSYEAFRSSKYSHQGWWLGIKKNGRPKAGYKTAWGQKLIQFIIIGINQ